MRRGGWAADRPKKIREGLFRQLFRDVSATGSFQNTADWNPGSGILNFAGNGSPDIFIRKPAGDLQTFPRPRFRPAIRGNGRTEKS